MHLHPLVYVCITYEKTKVKSLGENQKYLLGMSTWPPFQCFGTPIIAAIYDGEGSQFFCFV